MKIGYARVSTEDQNLDMQRQALSRAGCEEIFDDTVSGAVLKRAGLAQAMKALKPGDVLVVWRLDRLGRSLPHLIDLLGVLGSRRVEFLSLCENIDTTTAGGRLVFHVMAALAEFERALIGERTREGLATARRRGVRLGRRKALCASRLNCARARIGAGERPENVARSLQVGRSTLYRALRAADSTRG